MEYKLFPEIFEESSKEDKDSDQNHKSSIKKMAFSVKAIGDVVLFFKSIDFSQQLVNHLISSSGFFSPFQLFPGKGVLPYVEIKQSL